jgi:hypothetical protein
MLPKFRIEKFRKKGIRMGSFSSPTCSGKVIGELMITKRTKSKRQSRMTLPFFSPSPTSLAL